MAASVDPPGGPTSGPLASVADQDGVEAVDRAVSEATEQTEPAGATESLAGATGETRGAEFAAALDRAQAASAGIERPDGPDLIAGLAADLDAGRVTLDEAIDVLSTRAASEALGLDRANSDQGLRGLTGITDRAHLTDLVASMASDDPYLADIRARLARAGGTGDDS